MSLVVESLDESDDIVEFSLLTAEQEITSIDTLDRLVCWDLYDFEGVDFVEFFFFGLRGSGHSREFAVQSEIVLERDRCECTRLLLYRDSLLGLDCLVQSIRVATT